MTKEKHALLSASGAHRWLSCPPSAKLEAELPDKTSPYAREGTLAHLLAEHKAAVAIGDLKAKEYDLWLKNSFPKSDGYDEFFNAEMDECATAYADFIKAKLNETWETCQDAFAELEVKLDFSEWVPKGFGTGDCIIVADDVLNVIDLKYGKGVAVDAEDNDQMKLYALGALKAYEDLYDVKEICMTIFQPRLTKTPSQASISVDDLLEWAEQIVRPIAKLAYKGEGDFCPSESTCRFCKCRETCKARYEKNLSLFNDNEIQAFISVEEAAKVLSLADDIKGWLADLETFVFSTLMNGEEVPGWKIVEGRSNRKYADDLKVAEALTKAGYDETLIYEKKLLSLTALEKDFGKKAIDELLGELIVKPQGKPTLAPASDKRKPYQLNESLLAEFDK